MIVLYMSGGLGNQLFNYAAARALADRHGCDLVIDASLYKDQWHAEAERPLLIDQFQVRARFRNMGPEIDRKKLIQRILRRIREDSFVTEYRRFRLDIGGPQCWEYDPNFEQLGDRTTMKGYFINKKYFMSIEKKVREDLQLRTGAVFNDTRFKQLLENINTSKISISVHVRRGDHLLPQWARLRLDNMLNYYLNAIHYISERFSDAVFWVFSEDQSWCKRMFTNLNYDLRFPDDFSVSIFKSLRDFHLMSSCDHQVIANSTFSWWAAWLNENPKKLVLSPHLWDREGNIPIREIIPDEWVLIKW